MEKSKFKFPYRLQFFAESGEEGNNGGNQDAPENGGADDNNGSKDTNGEKSGKTFTQDEVNRMMTREKQQGKQSMLNSLGFKTEEEAKSAFNLLKALTDSQKSAEQKAEENKNTAVQEKADAEKRAEMAEAKLSCVMNGVNTDAVDDVLAIALGKITDGKTLDDVIGEMKKETRYSSFFTTSNNNSSSGNTGRTPQNNNGGEGNNATDYGKQLATKYGNGSGVKSKFF